MANTPNNEPIAVEKPPAKQMAEAYSQASTSGSIDWDLVEQYLPLVKSLVSRMRIYFPEYIDSEDIYSVGLNGLISAVRNFNPSKGRVFGSYAKMRVRGSLLDELRRIDWLSRDDRDSAKKYKTAIQTLEQKLGRTPTQQEICNLLEISKSEESKLSRLSQPLIKVPLDAPLASHGESAPSLHEILPDSTLQDGRDLAENHELVDLLRICLEELDSIPQKVLGLYYLEDLRLVDIATVLEVSESRICQIHAKAIKDLRIKLKEKLSQ